MPLNQLPEFTGLEAGKTIQLKGFEGSSKAFFLAHFLATKKQTSILVVPSIKEALFWKENVSFFLPKNIPVEIFPSLDVLPYFSLSPNPDLLVDRLRLLNLLHEHHQNPFLLITPLASLTRKLMPTADFLRHRHILIKGDEINRDEWFARLTNLGYQRTPLVEDRGTFAVRGGLVDIFSPAHHYPCRIEFFDTMIESIRFFNPENQKSIDTTHQVVVTPAHEIVWDIKKAEFLKTLKNRSDEAEISKVERDPIAEMIENQVYFSGIETYLPLFYKNTATLFDYLPKDCILFYDALSELQILQNQAMIEHENHCKKSTSLERIIPPTNLFASFDEILELSSFFPVIDFSYTDSVVGARHAVPLRAPPLHVETKSNFFLRQKLEATRHSEHGLKPLADEIETKRKAGFRISLVAINLAQKERLKDLLARFHLPLYEPQSTDEINKTIEESLTLSTPTSLIQLFCGSLNEGFEWEKHHQWWITDQEIFGKKTKKVQTTTQREAFSSFEQMLPGNYVVHAEHGVGLYKGLVNLEISKIKNDFLLLEYLGGDKLYVPVDQLNKIYHYTAQEGIHPMLDKMGGITWAKTREKVKSATRKLAAQLLQIQAVRLSARGYAFSPPDELYEEFEATFPFEETPDQERAIREVLANMQEDKPMDRLVCGDVGYGKTEVAIRAAFKAIEDHKQVALLVPTTVLAFQHFETFRKRFENYPTGIALLSRFQNAAEQKITLKKLEKGEVDIIIGTHRLLSEDITFKDLGLLIIDEEHRFGVAQKERMKKLKKLVDVLTLSATPIPRTLNFALTGIRDLSLINTPPENRLAIRTYVTHLDEGAIREAILREMKRGGQIYFVHNRVQSIDRMATRLQKIIPEAKIRIGHGQMPEEELEKVMVDFMEHHFDVLVCTTIIESGLDIPLANTMIINRADTMGLAQLYQLRGRVGRSHHRAYCYMLIPQDVLVTESAKKRLSVIQRFTELGSGFKIASHDLEIRGAGNILGQEQSGHIAAIGYELYIRLLEEAVMDLKGQTPGDNFDCEIKLPVAASIPDHLVPDTQLRLVLYKQASSLKSEEECYHLKEEWTDRFGNLPHEMENLINLILAKVLARKLKISQISCQGDVYVYQVNRTSPIPTDYFLKQTKTHAKKYKILPDGKFVIRESMAKSEEDLLKTVQKHLKEMGQMVN